MAVKEGTRGWGRTMPGAPVVGVDAIYTLTFGATPTGGTYKLRFDGFTTPAIAWNAVNVTLLASLNAALDALPNVGTSGIVATAGTLTAGVGTVLLTASGTRFAKSVMSATAFSIADNSLTPAATLTVSQTTAGTAATHRGAPIGAPATRVDTGILHVNTGTASAPIWTAQS